MRPTTMLAFLAGLLVACGRGSGDGDRRGTTAARDPDRPKARSNAPEGTAAEYAPFGPRSEQRRGQDSVLRMSGSRHRQTVPSDTT
jgi:hypothetical protein